MSIRVTFGAAIAVLLVAGSVVSGLEVRALGGINNVTVSPGHGRATAAFLATYTVSPCVGVATLTIGFSWGALPPAGPLLGTSGTDSACRATLSTTPPVDAVTHQPPAPGTYQVFGYVALPTGMPTPGTEVSAPYTVDLTPTATPTATATAHASATSHASATANPSASGNPTALASAPAPSIEASSAASVGAGQAATGSNSQRGNSTWTWWLKLAIILLVLVILALIAAITAWLVRRRHARGAAIGNDRAA